MPSVSSADLYSIQIYETLNAFILMKPVRKMSLHTLIVLTLMVSNACQDTPGSTASNSSSSAAQANVTPPKEDIHTAVLNENQEVLRQHIAAGTNLNERDPFGGSSPLITAALFGKAEMAKILIDAGADINFQNNDGSTPLHVAAFFCHPDIVQMLLKEGADKTVKNQYGATPYTSVAAPFEEVKNAYDMMGASLGPVGLTLDYDHLKKTRPEIAALLR